MSKNQILGSLNAYIRMYDRADGSPAQHEAWMSILFLVGLLRSVVLVLYLFLRRSFLPSRAALPLPRRSPLAPGLSAGVRGRR